MDELLEEPTMPGRYQYPSLDEVVTGDIVLTNQMSGAFTRKCNHVTLLVMWMCRHYLLLGSWHISKLQRIRSIETHPGFLSMEEIMSWLWYTLIVLGGERCCAKVSDGCVYLSKAFVRVSTCTHILFFCPR